jgi:hypothetical protein
MNINIKEQKEIAIYYVKALPDDCRRILLKYGIIQEEM